jgi:hypothetical protein
MSAKAPPLSLRLPLVTNHRFVGIHGRDAEGDAGGVLSTVRPDGWLGHLDSAEGVARECGVADKGTGDHFGIRHVITGGGRTGWPSRRATTR